jgi:hypothetical protein
MKKIISVLSLSIIVLVLLSFSNKEISSKPVKIEVQTGFKSAQDALIACEEILLEESFITENRTDRTLMAKRGGIKDGFYSASVVCTKNDEGVLVKITFIKKGAGFYSIKKLSRKIKEKLEETNKH